MLTIGIKQLKNRLSEYVKLAAGGEIVLVTDRNRVVAELIAPRPGRETSVDDAALAEPVRTGMVAPATMPGVGPLPRLPIAPTARILADLERDRAER